MFRFGATAIIAATAWLSLDLYGATASSIQDLARQAQAAENGALETDAMNLLRLGSSLSLKEATYTESRTGGGQNFDKNTGNSFVSNTAYHSFVEATCLKWAGNTDRCEQWLDAGISPHALEGEDYSPLEGLVMEKYLANYSVDQTSRFRIWDIQRDPAYGPGNFDADGKFREEGLVSMRLRSDVRQAIAEIGVRTAETQLQTSLLINDRAPKGKTAADETDVRMIAARYTKMFRNRLLANIGELRAADAGSDFLLSEDNPDCESYVSAVQRQRGGDGQRLNYQAALKPNTTGGMVDRFNRCRALRAASAYIVNAQVQGNGIRAGDKETESMRKWRTRLNLIAMDRVGIDLNRLPKPSKARIGREDLENEIVEHEVGGLKIKRRRMMTNAEQLLEYNQGLDSAANAQTQIAQIAGGDRIKAKEIRKNKIALASRNMVSINGLTSTMQNAMRKSPTYAKVSHDLPERSPASNLETRATQITVRKQ